MPAAIWKGSRKILNLKLIPIKPLKMLMRLPLLLNGTCIKNWIMRRFSKP
ncbi:hypothetical protein U14_03641 [Candidatus Moduliflexus flocculans]|uniref:Uncharacterized protein n=1 Tax=Candidatus Moduliflexus flocculans TaxID=1499966 RepID=A0A081BPS4_9BACT|nr:hypothetical protein U14_03641 [Candidatus Moduliflexus flocculans]